MKYAEMGHENCRVTHGDSHCKCRDFAHRGSAQVTDESVKLIQKGNKGSMVLQERKKMKRVTLLWDACWGWRRVQAEEDPWMNSKGQLWLKDGITQTEANGNGEQ